MKKEYVLAFDCAFTGASISLCANGVTRTRALAQGKQAVALVPSIDELMRETTIKYSDLGTIITTVGPGSFTGLRIGLATLHGLVLVHQTPIKTLTSLEALAWSVMQRDASPARFLTALKAGKGELCAQEFQVTNEKPVAVGEIFLVPETHDDWSAVCFGNHVAEDSPHYLAGADTELLCNLANQFPESSLADALPLYIRPPDAAIPQTPAWLAS